MIPYSLRDSLRAILLAPLGVAPLVLAAFFLTSALGGLTRGSESEQPELLLWCASAVIASDLLPQIDPLGV